MYIGRTAAYYDNDDEYIFVPDLWDIEEDADKLAGDIYELTEEGEELCYRYFHDLSCCYDLCNGRAKSLAAEYSREEFFAYVTDEKNGYIKGIQL